VVFVLVLATCCDFVLMSAMAQYGWV